MSEIPQHILQERQNWLQERYNAALQFAAALAASGQTPGAFIETSWVYADEFLRAGIHRAADAVPFEPLS